MPDAGTIWIEAPGIDVPALVGNDHPDGVRQQRQHPAE
jgi:hypothetical protein